MTKQEALDLIDRMPYITTIQATTDKVRMEFYQEAMDKNDPVQWVKIIKSCYVRENDPSGKKVLLPREAQFGITAKKLLHAQLAQALGICEDEVENTIKAYLAANT